MKRNNILVTGASGFVGQFLLERLIQTDCNKIVAMHKNPLNKSLKERFDDQITWNNTDLVSGDCCGLLSNIDIIFHLAGYSSVSTSLDIIDSFEDVTNSISDANSVLLNIPLNLKRKYIDKDIDLDHIKMGLVRGGQERSPSLWNFKQGYQNLFYYRA